MGASNYATKAQNNSVGYNFKWDVNDKLALELDAHDSTATNGADGPLGSNNLRRVGLLPWHYHD